MALFYFFNFFFLSFFVLALLTQDLKTGTVKATAVGWSKHPPKFYNVAEDFDCTFFFIVIPSIHEILLQEAPHPPVSHPHSQEEDGEVHALSPHWGGDSIASV